MLYYLYDNNEIIGLKYNNQTYFYKKNLQGDIIGLYNEETEQIATYTYDSWGKLLSVEDINGNEITDNNNIALINPFRYKSYYYDNETELYYLNSRYYNPTWCRFINADGIIGIIENLINYNYNLYTYCSNNPIINKDFDGQIAIAIPLVTEATKDLIAALIALGTVYGAALVSKYVDFDKPKRKKKKEVHQEYFPENPIDFKPRILIPVFHEGTKNGAIIEWVTPINKQRIFEWDENILHADGPHYHVLEIEWDKKHLDKKHYKAGEPVPEPWNTQYFGGD